MRISLVTLILATLLPAQDRREALRELDGSFRMARPATEDYGGVKFDLHGERLRLYSWLARSGHLERVVDEPVEIHRFNSLGRDRGGPLSEQLRWYPLVTRLPTVSDAWSRRRTTPTIVRVGESGAGKDYLVDLVPINLHGEQFTHKDLHPAGLTTIFDRAGNPGLGYSIIGERAADYREWTRSLVNQPVALICNGVVRSIPIVMTPLPKDGQIVGNFSKAEIDALVKDIRRAIEEGDEKAQPVELPAEAESRQAIKAMAAGQRKLRDEIPADRVDTAAALRNLPTDPESLTKLDGKRVRLRGFAIPIPGWKQNEYLLVGSLWSCSFGDPPPRVAVIRVIGRSAPDYGLDAIDVTGVLRGLPPDSDLAAHKLTADAVTVVR